MPTSKQKRGSKKPLRAFPEYEKLLDFRWRINQKPEVCVRDATINSFLFHWKDSGVRFRGCIFPAIKDIEGLNYDLAAILTDFEKDFQARGISTLSAAFQAGNTHTIGLEP